MQASNFGGTFDQHFLWNFLWHFHGRCLSTSSIPWCKKVKDDQKLKSRGSCLNQVPPFSPTPIRNDPDVRELSELHQANWHVHQHHIVWKTTFRSGLPQPLSSQKAGATQTETSLLKHYDAGKCVDLLDDYDFPARTITERWTYSRKDFQTMDRTVDFPNFLHFLLSFDQMFGSTAWFSHAWNDFHGVLLWSVSSFPLHSADRPTSISVRVFRFCLFACAFCLFVCLLIFI